MTDWSKEYNLLETNDKVINNISIGPDAGTNLNSDDKNVNNQIDQLINTDGMDIRYIKKEALNKLSACEIYNLLHGVAWYKKIVILSKLSRQNKKLYKEYRHQILVTRDKLNPNFNPDNVFEINNFRLWYANKTKQALFGINMQIPKNVVTAFIGPSGCGKSTLLRSLNRMNDIIPGIVTEGDIWFNGQNIKSKKLSTLELRTKVGMVFQKATPFEMSIYDNVAYGPRSQGIKDKDVLDELVENALKDAALWNEVKDDLDKPGSGLSGGQQQRLCIARAIVMKPTVLLMDEPTSALDPIATSKVEELILKLKESYTIILVTHSMTQAQRVSDLTAFFYKGNLIEYDTTKNIFTKPTQKKTRDYINGKF